MCHHKPLSIDIYFEKHDNELQWTKYNHKNCPTHILYKIVAFWKTTWTILKIFLPPYYNQRNHSNIAICGMTWNVVILGPYHNLATIYSKLDKNLKLKMKYVCSLLGMPNFMIVDIQQHTIFKKLLIVVEIQLQTFLPTVMLTIVNLIYLQNIKTT